MRTDLNKLDDALGVRRVFDVRVIQELQEQHKEDRSTVKRLRGAILSRLFQIVSLLIAGVSAILLVGMFFDITHPTARSTTEQATQSWGHFKGVVPPGLALTVNIALVALVASINIAIAAAAGRLSRREQLISSLWRRMLEWCAIAIAVGAGLFCILQLGSLHKPEDYGTAFGAIFIGGITAFLAITLAQYLNATDWARDFTEACEQRTNIIDWLEYIQDQGAPATIPAANPFRLKWRWVSKIPRLLATVIVIGFFDVIYTYGVLEIMVLIKKKTLVTPPMGWSQVLFIATIWAYSSAIAYVIGSATWQRWSTRRMRWRRFRLTAWPQIYRISYSGFVALFILALSASQSDEPATWGRIIPVSILMAGPFIFVPYLSWFFLWRSRKHADGRKRRLTRWLTEPVWQNVSKTLENAYRGQTKRRDESYDCDSTERRAPHLTKQGYAASTPTLWVPPNDALESAELIFRISRKS
ncbi:hypothetical protein [Mycobacteroides abscessus]|uniref:hypothetical protein n=1 Tax=Mycobacteroides abscessus TaxID=36809 RepID=UPI0005DBD8E1|nr:hypothetical protein [Mycobacteroides abscessus]CPR96154.1 Uncharacterised protein [Mycobacteroides abscessus]CPS62233.1 Uncharacterised protein [Mycobacteroides abscessus]CPY44565.1 Uncharacterised protein [Mycobacteroides abscessus]CPY52376.1 Uncharacterised protein [Mycobacteroides abscessus]SLI81022.1 Uncharacterised protein [Mycobacteroides abscessus subsp. abscessus]